jgi:hypothetical protein
MTNNVLCGEFAERLADLMERDVDEATRAGLESHALSCADCGSLLADMRKLRIDASNLFELVPSHDLWEGVAQRIDAPVIPLRGVETERFQRGSRWPRWAAMAAAAAVLIALTSTSTYFITVHSGTATPKTVANGPRPALNSTQLPSRASETRVAMVTSVPDSARRATPASEPRTTPSTATVRLVSKPSAEQVYSSEIARLRTIVEGRRAQLDPVTISVIERNLKVIDDAIAQCRLALAKDPASRFLMESLNSALETKVELLRTATMLPARS